MKFTKFVKSLASEGVIYETNQILEKAVMPIADGKIKDCVRVYQSEDGSISLPICNDDYGLIEKSDITEILYHYENDTPVPDALLIKKAGMIPTDEYELVGIIFPIIKE